MGRDPTERKSEQVCPTGTAQGGQRAGHGQQGRQASRVPLGTSALTAGPSFSDAPHHPLDLRSEVPSLGQDPQYLSPHPVPCVWSPGVGCREMILFRFGPLFSP